ncbi:MAG: sulfite exporter TauE/SafE family protein [Pseudomonadota bacterium]
MPDGLALAAALAVASFAGSFITVALGIGGGVLMLAVMASLLPPAALIPVHGVVQLGSNLLRAGLLLRHVHWPPFAAFALGTALGVAGGGAIAVNLAPGLVQMGVGVFVIWSVLTRPPRWLTRLPVVTGLISSFLSMFFGATGVFVANFSKALNLPRHAHVATHAVMMTLQHALKVAAFGALGFAYGPWLMLIAAMIGAGFAGTLAGRWALNRISDRGFKQALDVVLVLISLRLIWAGIRDLM